MAALLNKSAEDYDYESGRFHRELKAFHDNKGTPYRHPPSICGHQIDLYKLYWLVTAQGGWEKLNAGKGWESLLPLFEISPSTANGAVALKQIYLRYLESYEKVRFLGEDEDGEDSWYNDEEESRSRRQRAQKITTSVPLSYNHNQHNVNEQIRGDLNMCTKLYSKTDYDRLLLSLTSPLPNEQDFAINVCTLLSNEGRHTLKLAKCPRLLDLLLAHAGVYNHSSLKTYLSSVYCERRGYDFARFWEDVCADSTVRELMLDSSLEKNMACSSRMSMKRERLRRKIREDSASKPYLTAASGLERLNLLKQKAQDDLSRLEDDGDVFASGRGLGILERAGQRVLQVATVVRNLSFEEDNVGPLAQNATCLRFALLCASSSWNQIQQMGLDVLSNIGSSIVLCENDESCVTHVLLSTLTQCLVSQDRFHVISSLDILSKLCLQNEHEELIQHLLLHQEKLFFNRMIALLTLHDIHLLIATLECLYTLSNLGELTSNAIVRCSGAVDVLVALVTVEAQSYGPKACIMMRVVETVPGSSVNPDNKPTKDYMQPSQHASLQQQQQQTFHSNPSNLSVQNSRHQAIGVSTVSSSLSESDKMNMPTTGTVLHLPRHPVPLLPKPIESTSGNATPSISPGTPNSVAVAPVSQQVQLRVSNEESDRNFCLAWLRATYEAVNNSSIQQDVMYKQYLASLHKLGHIHVLSSQLYAACVRSVFGGTVGPMKQSMPNGGVGYYFEGVRIRKQALPIRVTQQAPNSNSVVNSNGNAASPILTNLLHGKSQTSPELQQQQPNSDQLVERKQPALLSSPMHQNGPIPTTTFATPGSQQQIFVSVDNHQQNNHQPQQSNSKIPSTMVNGVGNHDDLPSNATNQTDYSKMNGNGETFHLAAGQKRPANNNFDSSTPSKQMALDPNIPCNGIVNGGINDNNNKSQHVILQQSDGTRAQARFVTNAAGQQMLQTVNGQIFVKPNNGTAQITNNHITQQQPRAVVLVQQQQRPGSSAPLSPRATSIRAPSLPRSHLVRPNDAVHSVPKPNPQLPFLCEWQHCMQAFKTPKEVETHAIVTHCPVGEDDIPCMWLRCDGMRRKRFSLMTHIQDRHCHPQLMKLMAVRRVQLAKNGKSEVPLPPAPPLHPGYAPNAALQAIKRHASEFATQKALAFEDEKEGPVTKSIRLTAALILKNLVLHSSAGKKRLKSYESHLANVALSNVESSRTVSQILGEISAFEDE